MCGIAGFVNREGKGTDSAVLERMCGAIAHRGPDDDGFYTDNSAALGMRRLSIIDVAGGHQPIHNADKTKWIVFNGEIYNYQKIRGELDELGYQFYTNSDTEAIIHLYERYGVDCVRTRPKPSYVVSVFIVCEHVVPSSHNLLSTTCPNPSLMLDDTTDCVEFSFFVVVTEGEGLTSLYANVVCPPSGELVWVNRSSGSV